MSTPLFNRTGSDDFPIHLKALITGPAKSGKTSFLGTVPGIVIADTEPHANNLASVAHLDLPYVTINGTDDLQRLRFVLANQTLRDQAAEQLGMPDGIKAVAIDTLDTLQGIMKKERLKETRKSEFLRDDWGWLKEEMTAILEAFTALPLHVFFTVHTKTQELGKGDDIRTVILPGLQGAIAESIAGMVGYSLLSYRKQAVGQDGTPFTKYWLRAEGDETYNFLGNRAAGRLPDVIEPDFQTLLNAALAGRPTQQKPPVELSGIDIQTTGQKPANESVAQGAGQQGPSGQDVTPPRAPDDDPMNASALGHVKKVYDAIHQPFPEDLIRGITLGEGRSIVLTWKAILSDYAEGKGEAGQTAESLMTDFLANNGWLGNAPAPAAAQSAVEPKVDGTIDQVMAYVGDDLARIQEAFDLESRKEAGQQRSSLLASLVKKGAKDSAEVQTSVENSGTVEPSTSVTSDNTAADATTAERQAVEAVSEGLGGQVLGAEVSEAKPCEACGKPVDDLDIARLSQQRYGRWLCVEDYLVAGK